MFSRLFGYPTEPFMDNAGFKRIQQYFSAASKPGTMFNSDPAIRLDQLSATPNSTAKPIIQSLTALAPADTYKVRQAACEGSGSGDQFDHLVSLANNMDTTSQMRCGWVYNTQDPKKGRGALGMSSGPMNTTVQGTWMWDVQAAKQKYHINICASVKNCNELDSYPFKGRCGWCKTSGKAVPINSDGSVAYPSDPINACSASSLVTGTASCPAGTPAGQSWSSLPNGHIPRAGLISEAEQAGCSDAGTLIQALKAGSDTDYFDRLRPLSAYTIYQQRAIPSLNEQSLKTGNITISQALTEFNHLNEQASSSVSSGLRFAARDLCTKAGTIDEYDFCSEIQDSSRGPYSIDCLQKTFLQMGGQKTGTLYPSGQNLATWNALTSWLNVKNFIQQLQADTKSTTRSVQEKAIKHYYGIRIQQVVPLEQIPGVEIFWFSLNPSYKITDPTIFFGRRIRSTIPSINQSNDLQGAANMSMVSMEFFTNVQTGFGKATLRIVSDDGAAVYLNRPISNIQPNAVQSDSNSIIGLRYQGPTQYTSIWTLPAGQPNVVSGFWFQGNGGLFFSFQYEDGSGKWHDFPSNALFLTQEAYAPMINFQVYREPAAFGADFNFADTRMGGFKMKWHTLTGTPGWNWQPNDITGLPSMSLRADSSITLNTTFKMYSFMTMTFCIQFNALPNNSVNSQYFITMKGTLGSIVFRVIGNGSYSQGVLQLSAGGPWSTIGTIKQGVPYLIVFRVNRANESDIYSVNSLSAGVQELNILQDNPTQLTYTAKLAFTTPGFSNPNSSESRSLIVGTSSIDLTWIHLYDYYLDTAGIQREVNNDWKYLKKYV